MSDTDKNAALLDEVASRVAIMQMLTRYSRGIDRCDEDALLSVWWPDATADYGGGPVSAVTWAKGAVGGLSRMHRTQHMLGNMIIDLDPADKNKATAETYCRAYHQIDGQDGGLREMVVGGRYLDKIERRDGEWRLLERRYVMDWNTNTPSTMVLEGEAAWLARKGARKPNDPYYTGA